MERIILQPALADLKTGDKHLPEMQRYISYLVGGSDRQLAAHNASLAYLSLMHAFAEEGLLQLAWAPRLIIDVGGQEHEVGLSFAGEMLEMLMWVADCLGTDHLR